MNKLKAVVFDMDGVLFDTERLCMDAWVVIAERYGLKNIEEVAYRCIGRTAPDTKRILREAYPDFDMAALHDERRMLEKSMIAERGLPKKPGAAEILKALKVRGVPLAIASSTRMVTVESNLRSAGFYEYFDAVIGGDLIERSKPHPDIYLAACKALKVAPESAAAVEDSFNGIRSAKAAGMFTVMVPDIVQPDKEILKSADLLCQSLAEAQTELLTLI